MVFHPKSASAAGVNLLVTSDANGHDLTYSLAVPAANGVAFVSSDGSWTYTPNNGYYGQDEFRVGVDDSQGNYTFSIVTVAVETLADTLQDFEDVHPRLYLDASKIDQLKLAVQSGGTHASLWNEFNFDESPDTVDWFGYTMSAFGKTESLLADDGASHEGFPYWEYGTEWLIKYAKLAEKFVGSHMLQNDWFKNSGAYVAYSMLGENDWRFNNNFLNLGDTEGINYAGPDQVPDQRRRLCG